MRRRQRGNALLEFTLVGIPMIFLLISVEELSRGMWIYSTLQHAVKEATRISIVHGLSCTEASSSCTLAVGDVAKLIEKAAVGFDPSQLNVVLTSVSNSQTCSPLKNCESTAASWPPSPDNNVGLPITISGSYPFVSAIAMFWPGQGAVRAAATNFSAESREEIRF